MKIEPHADLRKGATMTREAFIAFVDAGFTEDQALELVKVMLSNSTGGRQ